MEDSEKNENVAYSIFDNNVFIEEWNQKSIGEIKKQTQELQGKARTVSFRPTPLNTSPRPPGSPPPWIIDVEDDENDKE